MQKKEYRILFDDKELSSQICLALGLNMAKLVDVLDPAEDYITKIKSIASNNKQKKLIIKPTRGRGGGGVQLIVIEDNDSIHIRRRHDVINLNDLKITERFLVQEFIEQDEELSKLTSSASIRLITLITRTGEILFLNGEINIAVQDNIVSNWSAGGICIGIDLSNGKLRDMGYDQYGHKYTEHPTSQIKFAEYTIPKWIEICDFAMKIQNTFKYYKLLGPDIALSKNGPMLYEINSIPDLGATEQINGPLLANKKIREEFIRYNLLINNALR